MEFSKRYNGSVIDLEFQDAVLVYLSVVGRFTDLEIGLNNRRGSAQTYDHTRKVAKGKGRLRKGKNDPNGTFPMCDFTYRGDNKCDEDGEVDNSENFGENWDGRQYQ